MPKLQMVRKVTCITSNKEQPSDLEYWRNRPVSERIDAIEILREFYMGYKKYVPQRVYRITRQA